MSTLLSTMVRAGLATGVLLVAACGNNDSSGSSDPVVSGTDVPTSATTSSAGALAFVKATAATSNETADALVVGDVTLATSETDEPDASI